MRLLYVRVSLCMTVWDPCTRLRNTKETVDRPTKSHDCSDSQKGERKRDTYHSHRKGVPIVGESGPKDVPRRQGCRRFDLHYEGGNSLFVQADGAAVAVLGCTDRNHGDGVASVFVTVVIVTDLPSRGASNGGAAAAAVAV